MLDKILQIEKKYNELGITLSDPAVIQDYNKFRDLSKQRKSMEETVELYYAWKKATDAIEEAKEMIHAESDEEMKSFLKAEMAENEAKLPEYEERMKVLLLPRDPMDDKDIMLDADYIVDIGPKAGRKGGEVVFAGTPQEMLAKDTLTANYLNGKLSIPPRLKPRKGNGQKLVLRGAKGNNLKDITLTLPLGRLICVSGVSGSGKSSLVNATLQPILSQRFFRSQTAPLPYDKIEGIENIDKVVTVDQSPLGKSPRSNPATYTGVFTAIRDLFASLSEAKIRGYRPGRFSFNVSGGRCETCAGNGYKTIEMNFLPDVLVPCETCGGKRYNRETLEVRFKGKSIADVLDMTINQAVEFFAGIPAIINKIQVLKDIGLGYIKLGQPSSTLSGGENQRVKLATELSRRDTGKTLFILDEPTTGLHFDDIRVLLTVLNRLVDKGNTVLVIEHNLDVICAADHVIDMGPGGGKNGGHIITTGTPAQVAKTDSPTAPFIREQLGLEHKEV